MHDPAALPLLIPAAGRDDRMAAYLVATFPAARLRAHAGQLRRLADQSHDLDCRLWLGVAVAKDDDPRPLRRVIDDVTPRHAPLALRSRL